MFKLINNDGKLTKTAKDVFQGAYIAGHAREIIIFPNSFADDRKYELITDLMKSINFEWRTLIAGNNEDLYVYRRWFYEAVSDRSEAALTELKNIIR